MGKFSRFLIRSSAVIALLGLGALHTAKADTVTLGGTDSTCTTSTIACWTNVQVFGNGNGNLNNTFDTVEFFTNPGSSSTAETVLLFCTSGCGAGNANANRAGLFGFQVFTGTTTAPTLSTTPINFIFDENDDYVGVGPFGENGPGSAGFGNVADYWTMAITNGGTSATINIAAGSLDLSFTLPPATTSTPEPSSLLMLGSGLMGLVGFGLRRKGINA